MKSLVQRGRTLKDAIIRAWEEAGKPEAFRIRILRRGKKGFLWFGGEDAVVSIEYDIKELRKRPQQVKDSSLMLEKRRGGSDRNGREPRQSRRRDEGGQQRKNGGSQRKGASERRAERKPREKSERRQAERRSERRTEPQLPRQSRLEAFVEAWASEFLQAVGAADVPYMIEQGEDGKVVLALKWDPFGSSRPEEVAGAIAELLRATVEKELGEEAAQKVDVKFSS